MYVSFTRPSYLIFLFGIVLLVFFHFYGLKNLRGKTVKFANFDAIASVKGIDLYSRNISGLVFNVTLVFIIVLALAGLTLHTQLKTSSFSFVIAIDSSQSMEANDFLPQRITVAKDTAIDFVNTLPINTLVGVISFAGNSFVEQEITKNKQEITNSIKNLKISKFGGTDIHEAMTSSINLFYKLNPTYLDLFENERGRAIILISDGQINVGDIDETIRLLRDNDIIVHTIAMGTIQGGETSFGISKLDQDTLKSISFNTEGKYFSVGNSEELRESFNQISESKIRLGAIDLTNYLLISAIFIFIIIQLLNSLNKIVW